MIERRCFTLLEVVLAMSIFAVLTMLTGAVVYALPRSYAMQREQARRMEGLGRLERVLDGALRNAVPFSWKDANGVSKQVFLGEPAWMIFAFRCRIEEGGGGLESCATGGRGGRGFGWGDGLGHGRECSREEGGRPSWNGGCGPWGFKWYEF